MESIRTVIARNVRKYRMLKKLSQEKLSIKSDLHHSYVGFLEREQYNPSAETLEKIAKILDVTEAQLMERGE